jgi:SAM-dependent methyltransferase
VNGYAGSFKTLEKRMSINDQANNSSEGPPNFKSRWGVFAQRLRRIVPRPLKNLYRVFFPRSMTESFSSIYASDAWQGGSGRGSTPENTVEYRALIERLLQTHNIKSVIDIGCGDWQFSHLINWGKIDYLGIDTVPAVIEANRNRYGLHYRFEHRDVTRDALPPGDLVILKDVLQHWPNAAIQAFLPRLEQYRFVLVTNSAYESPLLNSDIAMTGFRPLDLRQAPFLFEADELLRYHADDAPPGLLNKLVLLHESRAQ